MSIVFQIIVFAAVVGIVVAVGDILSNDDSSRLESRVRNFRSGTIKTEREKLESSSIIDRLTKVVQKEVMSLFSEKMSKGDVGKLQAKIMKAGMAGKIEPNEFRAQRFVYGAIFGILTLVILKNPLYALGAALIGALYPDSQLGAKIKDRQEQIKDEIPDFLDILAATFPGSKGFEDAIERICQRSSGVIVTEFKVYADEVNVGKRKRDALRALGDRCNVKEVDMLVNQIIQSEALGTGLEDTLNSQAKKLRMLKKTQAEIKAKKASATMLTSVLFSMTSILIIVGGPALLQIMEAMG